MSSRMDKMNSVSPYCKAQTSRSPISMKPYYALSLIILLGIWFILIVGTSESQRRFLVPHPFDVARRMIQMFISGNLLMHISVTLFEIGLGLLTGTIFAILLGYLVAHNALFAYLLEPAIVISQAVPIVALAPLLTVWFGPGLTSKIVVCSLIVFFPILVSVINGLNNINPQHRALFQLLEAKPAKILISLEIPATLPAFLSGLKVGSTLASMGAVVGEFVASSKGLGYLVKQGQNLYDLPMMFASIFILMGITIILYFLMTALERKLIRWGAYI
jgi:NitT/TauT family transport system permease protein